MKQNPKRVLSRKAISGLKMLFACLICALSFPATAQPPVCNGVVEDSSSWSQAAAMSCPANSAAYKNKYSRQRFYIPTVNDPLITLKLVLHVFTPSNPNWGYWHNNSNPINGVPGIMSVFSLITNDNTERYSDVPKSNYTVSGYTWPYIQDSRIRYELVKIYFYPNSDALYNSSGFSLMSHIETNYPGRLDEGLPIIFTKNGGHASSYFGTPYVCTFIGPGFDTSSQNAVDSFSWKHLRHEIGHTLGLMHPYYGGPGWPAPMSCCPESLNCNDSDFLSDLFPLSNPHCSSYGFPNPPNPPTGACGNCYEVTPMATNNLMGDYGDTSLWNSWWITPLQMGRRIRRMHLNTVRKFAKDTVSNHLHPWLITSNETWDFDIQMYRDIVVKNNATLTIKCKVAMATDGKIIVEKGGKLLIDSGLVTGWCKKTPSNSLANMPLWKGIELEGSPTLNQVISASTGLCTNQGIVEVRNGGTISHAQFGIYGSLTTNNGTWIAGTSGGIVIANKANFENNVFDIVLYQYQNNWNTSKIWNSTFTTTGLIGKDGNGNNIAPAEHIKLYGNKGLSILGCTFEYQAGSLYPAANRGVGVYTTDASVTIDQLPCSGTGCPSSGFIRNQFRFLTAGIWMDNFNPLFSGAIRHSDFYGHTQYAVIAEVVNSLDFGFNTVAGKGIYLKFCKLYNIRNNAFTGLTSLETGVSIFESENGSHQVYRNSFSLLNFGIVATDSNWRPYKTGLKMNCNDFDPGGNGNYCDIALTPLFNTPVIDPSQSPSGVSLNPGNAVRNIYGAPYFGAATRNKFFVHSSNTQTIIHASVPNTAYDPNFPQVQASPQVMVAGVFGTPDYNTDCPGSTGSGGGAATSNAGRLNLIDEYLMTLKEDNGEGQNDFEIQACYGTKLNIYLTDTLPGSDDSVIAILQKNPPVVDDADLLLVFAYMKKFDYTSARTAIDDLGSSRSDWADLLTRAVDIEESDEGVLSLQSSSSDVSFLNTYATTRGMDGEGNAQAWLKYATGQDHDLPIAYPDFDNPEPAMGAKDQQSIDLQIIPNPGTGLFQVSTNLEKATLEVYDPLGKKIRTINLEGTSQTYSLDLRAYAKGMYIITIRSGNLTHTRKLILE